MTDTILSIREMCDMFNVTPRTLRFYESKELITPARTGRKRLYNKRDCARLILILRGKRFGFSLEEIRQLLNLYDHDDQQETQMRETYQIGQRHLTEMISQRAALDDAITDLRTQLNDMRDILETRQLSPE
jgi:DNA-binding transcriptional MerR regulator